MATRTKTKVTPLADRVLARRLEETETSRGGIIIPDTAKEKPQRAEIIAVGAGRRKDDGTRVPVSVAAGDQVLMSKYSGTDVTIDGEDYVILREDDILGIIADR